MSTDQKAKPGSLQPAGSALVDMAIGDYVAMLERQNKYLRKQDVLLRAALKPFAALLDGNLEHVGDGTLIAPTIKVQMVKDAKDALTPNAQAQARRADH